jgi:hypothetical protein
MPELHAVSPERHGSLRWTKIKDYSFAANDLCCPLVIAEVPSAMRYLPIAFAEIDGFLQPVSVQGFQESSNLLVAGNGQWVARYVPALYRGLPFLLANSNDAEILCINEELVQISSEESEESIPFFDEDGKPSSALQSFIDFHTQISQSRKATHEVVKLLKEHDLIVPWNIELQTQSGKIEVEGLNKIDEGALNGLEAAPLAGLRDSGALLMAYCQLLSMQNITDLVNIARLKVRSSSDELFTNPDDDLGNVSFDNL